MTDCNRVLAVLQQAQLHNRGSFPVVVVRKIDGQRVEHNVLKARFNTNSGNVELTIKE